ncbi:MAG: NADPH-dependent FMN reductase [Chthoniobacter sp. 12-60-6]|nr:MAG: NADPH-dependent FMN reductase [Chthoniobacter sp. 12-60-6]
MSEGHATPALPEVRTGQGSTKLSRNEFEARYLEQFADPAFDIARADIGRVAKIAWEVYQEERKSPRTRKAGAGFANPEHELSIEWLAARARIQEAQSQFESRYGAARILLICASPRTDETCPGEMSKTFRLARQARKCFEAKPGCLVDFLDLSELTSEYGRQIHPCKACVSTAMPLCHWPCSCYPNHYMGQIHDWMNDLYPRWVAAHGVMIISPVHWYQAPSVLKLMMDRLVCADGGNPDPTTTDGKDAAKAKAMELKGWHYPKHLAGRIFSVITHGDAEGTSGLRRDLHDWLLEMELVPAGAPAVFDRYIGYYEPYAASHEALDRDDKLMKEVENAALTLREAVNEMRDGRRAPGRDLAAPRSK